MKRLLFLLLSTTAMDAPAETLAAAIGKAEPGTWIEYRVPLIDPERSPCCWGSYRGEALRKGCSLDGRNYSMGDDRAVGLPGGELRIFLKRGATGIDRVQAYGSDCPVDVEGASLVRAQGITPADSLKTLGQWIVEDDHKVRDGALMALSSHEGAVPVLRAVVESDRPKAIRRDALFWLGQVGDEAAFAVFDELLAEPGTRRPR